MSVENIKAMLTYSQCIFKTAVKEMHTFQTFLRFIFSVINPYSSTSFRFCFLYMSNLLLAVVLWSYIFKVQMIQIVGSICKASIKSPDVSLYGWSLNPVVGGLLKSKICQRQHLFLAKDLFFFCNKRLCNFNTMINNLF